MIHIAAQVVAETRRTGEVLFGAAGGSAVFGLTIGQVNQYLQAGAFVVTMVTGTCAAVYYIVQTLLAWRKRNRS